ncbi:MAG: (2Fe-2S) ferredoxin domain-containing protein [Deltaproteobacteria bacterium]|jgi:NADP-reducing hydrogenase subunit HndB|nr:(2Fe-2S) ferredoxin domain-containing protein [Deltaproteobacteria bacterium]
MPKLKIEDLDRISQQQKRSMSLREGAGRVRITVHMGTCGISAGARKIMAEVLRCLEKSKATDVVVTTTGCAGLCSREPMITVEVRDQAPVKYVDLDEKKTSRIFEEHVLKGTVVKDYALAVGSEQTL